MALTGVAAAVLKPKPQSLQTATSFDLQMIVPRQFGDWVHEPEAGIAMVDPQAKQLLDKIYSQLLSRIYRNGAGYRVMLAIAYGSDQRGALQAHKPEVCYPAQGFTLRESREAALATPFGQLPVRQLLTDMGPRKEPITYWFTIGESAALTALDRRVAEIKSLMTGRIPDGLLFRVSSIDADSKLAFQKQAEFVQSLLSVVPQAARVRLSGL